METPSSFYGMTGRREVDAWKLVSVLYLIVFRWGLGGRPWFRGEFVLEDFMILLALASGLVPSRFKLLISQVIAFLLAITMALMGWPMEAPKAIFGVLLFTLAAVRIAALAMKELSRLQSEKRDVPLP